MSERSRVLCWSCGLVFIFGLFFFAPCSLALTPPEDIEQGLSTDEQEGGGGLVGDLIRVLNGNLIHVREDLRLASAHRRGLGLQACYNSRSDRFGSLGHGWRHSFEVHLDPAFVIEGEGFLRITDQTGRARYSPVTDAEALRHQLVSS